MRNVTGVVVGFPEKDCRMPGYMMFYITFSRFALDRPSAFSIHAIPHKLTLARLWSGASMVGRGRKAPSPAPTKGLGLVGSAPLKHKKRPAAPAAGLLRNREVGDARGREDA